MQKSLAEIPQIQVRRRLDVAPLLKKEGGATFTHRLTRAAAAAVARHPALRTSFDSNRIRVEPVSVAIAMDSPHGLVAPVVRNADKLSLPQISAALTELRGKAEANLLRRAELIEAPFAISNLGMLGVDQFDAFVFHGQTAVLSVGRSVTEGGKTLAWFGLAVDHRVVDGAEAARFLETLQLEIAAS
jgi:pyruvate dehydrogenase E2 component (dihydrolipoamide acetyltransferase)